jgi:lycopene cyclase domain-containing protein
MNLYLLINLLIVIVPLSLSFDRKVRFFKSWPYVLGAILVVDAAYLVWDIWMTSRGDWGFNTHLAGGWSLLGLPLGEILFFITVPYSCLFIYETVGSYVKEKRYSVPRIIWFALSGVLIALAFFFRAQNYTFTVLVSTALFFLLSSLLLPRMLASRRFWLFMGITYIPFLIFNGILTALPVVTYSPRAIWGFRVYTIPVEDFFYSFSLLGFNALAFRGLKDMVARKERDHG